MRSASRYSVKYKVELSDNAVVQSLIEKLSFVQFCKYCRLHLSDVTQLTVSYFNISHGLASKANAEKVQCLDEQVVEILQHRLQSSYSLSYRKVECTNCAEERRIKSEGFAAS